MVEIPLHLKQDWISRDDAAAKDERWMTQANKVTRQDGHIYVELSLTAGVINAGK